MRTGGISLFGYAAHPADGHLHVYHPAPALSEAERIFVGLRRNLALKTFHLAQSIPEADYDRTVLFFGMGSEARITAFAEELRRLTSCYVSYYKDTYLPDNWLIEIFAHGVSKAAGISQLKQHLQADRIVAFGDNLNDIPMLRSADLAVAVGNALPETKEAADIVIGDNNSDSVARFIADDYARTL